MKKIIHILYVDDNPYDRELVKDALEKAASGFRVTEATSMAEFQKSLEHLHAYDAIITDLNILGCSGLEILQIINKKDAHLPVIIVTGTGSEETAVTAMKLGAADYVIKSAKHIQRLPQTIATAFEKRQLQIKERLATEELEKERNLLRTLIDNLPHAIYIKDNQGRFKLCNPEAMRQLRVQNISQVIGKTDFDFHPKEFAQQYRNDEEGIFRSGQPLLDREEQIVDAHGNRRWLLTTKVPIKDKHDKVTGLMGINRDITVRKKHEEQIEASLREKEVLLKEIHHRVKNNMQIISSLLNLQSMKHKDERIQEIFATSRNRIRSMALVHEKLYGSANLARINAKEYIETLAKELVTSYHYSKKKIALTLALSEVFFNIDTAVPLGLMVNEMITNSLKYAFPAGWQGSAEIKISLTAQNSEIQLQISDNGIGMPADLDIRNTKSLGMKLITMLIKEQLDGQVQVQVDKGTHFIISFHARG